MIIHQCDRCGKTVEQKKGEQNRTPTGWAVIQPHRYGGAPYYELCPDCCKKLNIPEGSTEQQKTIGDRLLEILEEIVQIQVEECGGCG